MISVECIEWEHYPKNFPKIAGEFCVDKLNQNGVMWYDVAMKFPKESLQVDLEGQKRLRTKNCLYLTIWEQVLLYNPRVFQVGWLSLSYYNILPLTGATMCHHTLIVKTEPIWRFQSINGKNLILQALGYMANWCWMTEKIWCIFSTSRFKVCIIHERPRSTSLQIKLDLTTPPEGHGAVDDIGINEKHMFPSDWPLKKDTNPSIQKPVEDLRVLERKGRAMLRLPPPPKVRPFRRCEFVAPLWALFHVGRYGSNSVQLPCFRVQMGHDEGAWRNHV